MSGWAKVARCTSVLTAAVLPLAVIERDWAGIVALGGIAVVQGLYFLHFRRAGTARRPAADR
jgi:hypothetical protein